MNKAFVLTHLGMGDNILMISAINYLAEIYDIVKVVCKTKYKHNIKQIYIHLKNVIIDDYEDDIDISPAYRISNYNKFIKITLGWDIFMCGNHIGKKINKLPSDMYNQICLDYNEIFKSYFRLPIIEESKYIFEKVKIYSELFIFVHEISSTEKGDFSKYYNNIKDDILVINPDKNIYDVGHIFYDIAKYLVRLPILHYMEIFKNCQAMYIMDSSFFALISQLKLSMPKYLYIRGDPELFDKELLENFMILSKN
jgi:hypothetical protein